MSSVRKNTMNRKTLIRECGTCGAMFLTSADTPWLRQVPRDGKRQVNTYYCCQSCYKASYKHLFDGKAEERKREWSAVYDRSEARLARRRERYRQNVEAERAKAKARYWADPEAARAANRYSKQKRKLLENKNA